jgi:hypothetical protein
MVTKNIDCCIKRIFYGREKEGRSRGETAKSNDLAINVTLRMAVEEFLE